MNEKPLKLPMDFGEALERLARTPKAAIDAMAKPKTRKTRASGNPPRSGRKKAA